MGSLYIGSNNIARDGSILYAGVNNVARRIEKIYIGDSNGIARLAYRRVPPYTPPTYSKSMFNYTYSGSSYLDIGESAGDSFEFPMSDVTDAINHGYAYLAISATIYNRKGDQGSYCTEYCANRMVVYTNVGSTYQPSGYMYDTNATNPDGVYKSVTRYHRLSDIVTEGSITIRASARDSSDNDLMLFTGGQLSVSMYAYYTTSAG